MNATVGASIVDHGGGVRIRQGRWGFWRSVRAATVAIANGDPAGARIFLRLWWRRR
jgi:hypothetical protein